MPGHWKSLGSVSLASKVRKFAVWHWKSVGSVSLASKVRKFAVSCFAVFVLVCEELLGFSFGLIWNRAAGVETSRMTHTMPELCQLLNRFGATSFGPGRPWVAIQVNKNYRAALHVDMKNLGTSHICGCGQFTGVSAVEGPVREVPVLLAGHDQLIHDGWA